MVALRNGKPTRFMESEEAGFHRALEENIKDPIHWLVYADWLQDNNRLMESELARTHGRKISGKYLTDSMIENLAKKKPITQDEHNKKILNLGKMRIPIIPSNNSFATFSFPSKHDNQSRFVIETQVKDRKIAPYLDDFIKNGGLVSPYSVVEEIKAKYPEHFRRGVPNRLAALTVPNNPQTLTIKVPSPVPVKPKPKQPIQQPQPRQPKLKGGIKTTPAPAYTVLPFSFGSDNRKNKRDGQPTRFMSDESPFHDPRYEEETYHPPSQEESFLDHLSRNNHYTDPTLLGAYADWMEEYEPHREAEIKMLRRAFIKHIQGSDDNNDYVLSGNTAVDYPKGSIALYRKGYTQDGPIEGLSYYHPSGVHKMHVEGPDEESIAKLAGNLVQNGAKTAPNFQYHQNLLNELQQKYPQHFQTEEAAQKYRRGKPSRFAEDYQAERPDAHYKVMKKVIPNFDKSFRVMQKQNPEGKPIPVKPDSDFAKHFTTYGHNLIGLHDEHGNLRQLGLLHRDPNQQYADNGEHGQAKEGVKMTLIGHHDDSERANRHLTAYLNGFSGYDQDKNEQGSQTLSLLHEAGNLAREKGDLSYFPGIDHLKETGFKFHDDEQNYYQTPKNFMEYDSSGKMNLKKIHEKVASLRQQAKEEGRLKHGIFNDMWGSSYLTIAHPDGRVVTRTSPERSSSSPQTHAEEMGYHHAYDPKKRLGHEGQKFDKARMLMQLEHAEKTGNLHFPRYEQPKEKMKRGKPARMMGIGCFSSPGPINATLPSYDGKKKKKKEPEKFGEDELSFEGEYKDSQEAQFHRHLASDPHDSTGWLVYSDWLEEHNREHEANAIRHLVQNGGWANYKDHTPQVPWPQKTFSTTHSDDYEDHRSKEGRYSIGISFPSVHDEHGSFYLGLPEVKSEVAAPIVGHLANAGYASDNALHEGYYRLKGKHPEYFRRGKPKRFEDEEAGFHRAIEENPDDPFLSKVYADWLEEQGRHGEAHTTRKISESSQHGHQTGSFRVLPAWEDFADHYQVDFTPMRRKMKTKGGEELRKLSPLGRVFIYRRMKHDPSKILETYLTLEKPNVFRGIVQHLRQSVDMKDETQPLMNQGIDKMLNLKKEQMRRGMPQRFSEDIESEETAFHRAMEEDRDLGAKVYADWLEDHGKSSIAQVIRKAGQFASLTRYPSQPTEEWKPGEWFYTPSVAVKGGMLRLAPSHKPDKYFQWPVNLWDGHDLEGIKNEADAVWENGKLKKKDN